jgi:hypothetical protein
MQLTKRPNPKYLEHVQGDMNTKMRAILVDWLVEVSEEYKLCADTLYQAVNYIDRFLSLQVVQRSQLQLVGVSCMWVAAKYEEIYPPNVADFCYITDNTYAKEQLIQTEEVVLKRLSYELTVPTAKTFLRRLLQVSRRPAPPHSDDVPAPPDCYPDPRPVTSACHKTSSMSSLAACQHADLIPLSPLAAPSIPFPPFAP